MSYTVVDDDTCLQVRASIEYDDIEDMRNLVSTLQNRLTKMEQSRERSAPNPVQSLPTASAEPAGGDGARIA